MLGLGDLSFVCYLLDAEGIVLPQPVSDRLCHSQPFDLLPDFAFQAYHPGSMVTSPSDIFISLFDCISLLRGAGAFRCLSFVLYPSHKFNGLESSESLGDVPPGLEVLPFHASGSFCWGLRGKHAP